MTCGLWRQQEGAIAVESLDASLHLLHATSADICEITQLFYGYGQASDGRLLLSAPKADGAAVWWDPQTGTNSPTEIHGCRMLASSADGRVIASAPLDEKTSPGGIVLFRGKSWTPFAHRGYAGLLSVRDGLTVDLDALGGVGRDHQRILTLHEGATQWRLPAGITSWSDDARGVAVATREAVEVWDTTTRRRLTRLELPSKDMLIYASWLPEGRGVEVDALGAKPRFRRRWDRASDHWSEVTEPAASAIKRDQPALEDPRGRWQLVQAAHRLEVVVHGVRRELLVWLPPLSRLCVTSDGCTLVTSEFNGTLHLWNLPDARLLATVQMVDNHGHWFVSTPDGLYDGTPGSAGQIDVWLGRRHFPMSAFDDRLRRPGLIGALLAGHRPRAPRAVTDEPPPR